MVKNSLTSSTGDVGSISGRRTKIPPNPGNYWAYELQSSYSKRREATSTRDPRTATRESPCTTTKTQPAKINNFLKYGGREETSLRKWHSGRNLKRNRFWGSVFQQRKFRCKDTKGSLWLTSENKHLRLRDEMSGNQQRRLRRKLSEENVARRRNITVSDVEGRSWKMGSRIFLIFAFCNYSCSNEHLFSSLWGMSMTSCNLFGR